MNFRDIREACCEANRRLPAVGLVDLTFGNASVLDPDAGVFAIKPSGVDYDALTPGNMVVVDLEGKVAEGDLRPSSDTPTHRHLFLEFAGDGVRSVVHTHSRSAVAFAQAGRDIPCLGTTHCDHFHGAVPVTRAMTREETETSYEWNTGKVIAETFSQLNAREMPAVLVRNHGPYTWGGSGAEAVESAMALEIVADMAIRTLAIDPRAQLCSEHLLDRHFFRKHGPGSYYGQGK